MPLIQTLLPPLTPNPTIQLFMDSRKPAQKTEWGELMSILKWMEQEGLVELYYDDQGRECVRITPEGMNFEFSK